jgi:hypothetical protein
MQDQDCDVHDGDAAVSSTLMLAPVINRAHNFLIYTGSDELQDDQF